MKRKWCALALIPLLAALGYHVQLVSYGGVFADAYGTSPAIALGGAMWNRLSWLALLLTLVAVAAAVFACIVRRGSRGLLAGGAVCAAASLALFVLVDSAARSASAINGLPYIYEGVPGLRVGLYAALGLAVAAAAAAALLRRPRVERPDRA